MTEAPATPDADSPTAAALASVTAASAQLNQRANAVFRATAALIGSLVTEQLEGLIFRQPAAAEALEPAALRKLRQDLEAALARLPGTSAKRLAGAFGWTFPKQPAE